MEALKREIASQHPDPRPPISLDTILQRVCTTLGIPPTALQEGSRRSSVCRAREGIAYLALEVGGYPGPRLVSRLGVRPPSIYKAAQRGRQARNEWDRVLKSGKK